MCVTITKLQWSDSSINEFMQEINMHWNNEVDVMSRMHSPHSITKRNEDTSEDK